MATRILSWLKEHTIPAFFILTFSIAWSLWLPLGFLSPQNYLWILVGAWAPTISALLLIGISEGRNGIKQFLKKLLRWQVGIQWYLVVLFGCATIAFLAIRIGMLFGLPSPEPTLPSGLSPEALLVALPLMFVINIFLGGPLAEDVGWRGFILPKMREHMSAFQASLIIGVIWAVWHLPFFVFPGWHDVVGNIPFLWFLLLTTSWSVLFAWVYVNTDSILMPVLFHAAINTTLGTLGVLGQTRGNLSLLMINTLLTWFAVGIVLLFFGWDLNHPRYPLVKQDRRIAEI